jgi:hypothetical protein
MDTLRPIDCDEPEEAAFADLHLSDLLASTVWPALGAARRRESLAPLRRAFWFGYLDAVGLFLSAAERDRFARACAQWAGRCLPAASAEAWMSAAKALGAGQARRETRGLLAARK